MQIHAPVKIQSWHSVQPAPVAVLCLHGIESHADWFEDFGRALSRLGIDCHAYDRSGSGRNQNTTVAADSEAFHLAQLLDVVGGLRKQYRRLIVVGMSWGGLLAAFFLAKSGEGPDRTLLLAPGIFPARQLPSKVMLKAAVALIVRPGLLVELPYKPEDFSADARVVEKIASDSLRRTRVSARLLATTLSMQRFVRKATFNPETIEMWLPETDAVIDLEKSRAFAAFAGIRIREFKGRSHCLVLECPDDLAQAVRDVVSGASWP